MQIFDHLKRRTFLTTLGAPPLTISGFGICSDPALADTPHTMRISENRDVDVLVAGGGMTGVFAAAGAMEKGMNVVIIE
ncbi:MAG: hypothetical protein ABIH23_12875, partial [bacterium]